MRAIVPLTLPTAHTAPGAAARLKMRAPDVMRATTLPLSGSMRRTSPPERLPAQRLPFPAASPYVQTPTSTFAGVAPASATRRDAAMSFIVPHVDATEPEELGRDHHPRGRRSR